VLDQHVASGDAEIGAAVLNISGVSLARTTMSCRSRRFVAMTSLREEWGSALGRMPTRASSGAVSSKIRPFDNAMLMLAMCNHPGIALIDVLKGWDSTARP